MQSKKCPVAEKSLISTPATEHPNGEQRKTPRRLEGYSKQKKAKRTSIDITSPSQAIDLAVSSDEEEERILDVSEISSEEWTDDSDSN